MTPATISVTVSPSPPQAKETCDKSLTEQFQRHDMNEKNESLEEKKSPISWAESNLSVRFNYNPVASDTNPNDNPTPWYITILQVFTFSQIGQGDVFRWCENIFVFSSNLTSEVARINFTGQVMGVTVGVGTTYTLVPLILSAVLVVICRIFTPNIGVVFRISFWTIAIIFLVSTSLANAYIGRCLIQ